MSLTTAIGSVRGAIGVIGDVKGAIKDPVGTIGSVTGINSAISTLDGALDAIGAGGIVSGTIGNVLSNGGDLSCWGSSYSPNEAKQEIAKKYAPYWQSLIDRVTSTVENRVEHEKALNFLIQQLSLYMVIKQVHINDGSFAKCTRDGWKELRNLAVGIYNSAVTPLISEYVRLGATSTPYEVKGPLTLTFLDGKTETIDKNGTERATAYMMNLSKIYMTSTTKPKVEDGTGGTKNVLVGNTKLPIKPALAIKAEVDLETFDGGTLQTVTVKAPPKQPTPDGGGFFPWWLIGILFI